MNDDDKASGRQQAWRQTVAALHRRLDAAVAAKTYKKPSDLVDLMRAADELLWLDQHAQTFDLHVERDRRQLDRDFD